MYLFGLSLNKNKLCRAKNIIHQNQTMKNRLQGIFGVLAIAGLVIFASCEDEKIIEVIVSPIVNVDSIKTEAVKQYAEIVYQSYVDSKTQADALKTAIDNFVVTPTETNFALAKNAWLIARVPYGQTEVYRFYMGPIDAEPGGPEGDLNSWPLNESYIDYVEGMPEGGIINDVTITITEAYLRSNNAQDVDEVNVSIGYHAIEFLLWGQDDGDASKLTSGNRSFTDYTTADNATRRGEYLKICAEMVSDDLQILVDAWKPDVFDNYRATFVADDKKALESILTGMGSLSKAELGGERMNVALVNHDQEDEHSCFSDNTHTDIAMNAKGIQNAFLGTYIATNGTAYNGAGLYHVILAVDTDLAEKMKKELEVSVKCTNNIQAPFDFEISSDNPTGNKRVRDAITALQSQANTMVDIATKLGLTINTDG